MKTLLVCLACLAALGGPASGAQAVGGSTPPEQRADPGVSQGNPPSSKGGGAGAGYSGPGDTTPSAPPTLPAPGPADPEGAGNPGGPQPPPTAPDGPPGGKTDDGAQGGLGGGSALGGAPSTQDGLGEDLTDWHWWWTLNQEPFLVLPSDGDPNRPASGRRELLGRDVPAGRQPPTDATLYGQVVPGLLRTLSEDHPDDLLAATALALGRIGAGRPASARGAYAQALRARTAGASLGLRSSLLLALGVLADESSAPFLADLMLSTREGREALSTSRIPIATRTAAAYALGILGSRTENEDVRRYIVHQLVWCMETDRTESTELDVACVNALGVVAIDTGSGDHARAGSDAPPGSSLTAQVDYLLALLGKRGRDSLVRAQVPIAIARLLTRTRAADGSALRARVAEQLMDRIAAHRREPREVVQSCILALGQLGDGDGDEIDRRVRRVLMRVEDLVNDLPSRQFALISLGRACGRAGASEPASLREEREYLLKELGRGSTLMRPWAALALGLWLRGDPSSAPAAESTRLALRTALAEARSDHAVGAYALAVGLARDDAAAEPLLAHLEGWSEPTTRSELALALGLTGVHQAQLPLVELLPTTLHQPLLLQRAALALALLGARESVPLLTEALSRTSSSTTSAAIAWALARSKDERAVAPLLDLYADEGTMNSTRVVAAAALGSLGDRSPLPWKTLYSVDANYHAAPASLFAPAGSGLLNLLW